MVENNSTETFENIVASFKVRKNQPDFWYGILNELEVGEKKPNRPSLKEFYKYKKVNKLNKKQESISKQPNNLDTNSNNSNEQQM